MAPSRRLTEEQRAPRACALVDGPLATCVRLVPRPQHFASGVAGLRPRRVENFDAENRRYGAHGASFSGAQRRREAHEPFSVLSVLRDSVSKLSERAFRPVSAVAAMCTAHARRADRARRARA